MFCDDDGIDAVACVFDFIIFDTPPVLAVTDAVLLAPQCDATVIVASAYKTDLRALEVTQETLERVGASVAGVIVNRFRADKGVGYKYGYGYYRPYAYTEADA